MAEVLLRRALPDAEVTSAGTMYEGGAPASPGSVRAMAARGLALDGHVSRELERAMLLEADVVIGMARHHVDDALLLAPEIAGRVWTLRRLAGDGDGDVADPIGRPDAAYERTAAELEDLVERAAARLRS